MENRALATASGQGRTLRRVSTRSPGDPWYTALYRDPHTYWWLPSLLGIAVFSGVFRLLGHSTREALAAGLIFGLLSWTMSFVGRGRSRE